MRMATRMIRFYEPSRLAKRVSAAAAALLFALTPAQADDPKIGSWEFGSMQDSRFGKCVMAQGTEEPGILFAFINDEGKIELGFRSYNFDFGPNESSDLTLDFDGVSIPILYVERFDGPIILFDDDSAPGKTGPVTVMQRSNKLYLHGRGFAASFDLSRTSEALAKLRDCARASGIAIASSSPRNSPDQETDASKGVDDALGSAMRGMTSQQPPILQLRCLFSDEGIYGLPYMGSTRRSVPKTVTVSVAEDGSALINGSLLKPQQMERASDGSSRLIAAAYALQDVTAAMLGGSSLPSIGTFSAEENAALRAMPGLMNGIMGQVMGDRRRFMMVSLDASSVVFFDLSPQSGAVNGAEAECVRTM